MTSKDYLRIFGLVLLIFFLFACGSAGTNASAPTPIPQANIEQTLEVMVAQTSAAAQTQTVIARPPTATPTLTRTPSRTPTQSLTPTPTFFFSLFSPTPTLNITIEATNATLNANSTQSGIINLGNDDIPTIKRMWACHVRYSPDLKVRPNAEFFAQWEVANIGSEPWTSNTVDFVYKGGYKHEGRRIQDLRSTVRSGGLLIIGATFIAPKREGAYHSHYVLQVGRNMFCPMWMNFKVSNSW